MTLPASGPLTRTQIRTEFGLASTAIWPNDYFGLGGAPSARPLKFSDFHGRSGFNPATNFSQPPGTYNISAAPFTIMSANPAVVWTFSYTGHTVDFNISSGDASGQITMDMGTNNTFSVWSATVTVTGTYAGVDYHWTVNMTDTGLN